MPSYRTGTGAMNLDNTGRRNVFKKGGALSSAKVLRKALGGKLKY